VTNTNSTTENIGDTGNGFIVGTQPAQPRLASDWAQQQRPDQAVSQPVSVSNGQPQEQRPAYRWTDEDIEAARKQEKDKLYGRIEDVQTQLKTLQSEREAEAAERQRLADEAAEARRTREEAEMETRDLLTKRESEWRDEISKLNARYDADREVFQKERQLQEAELYRRDRIAQEANDILPELRDFIQGSTPDEIDQSIEMMKARTASVVANFVAVEPPQVPFQPRGAAPTAPPVGPMEQLPSYESLTPEDIKGMDMDTYKRYRSQLLQATSPRRG
jgi:hypothetical protein